jgi:hypothetical protein
MRWPRGDGANAEFHGSACNSRLISAPRNEHHGDAVEEPVHHRAVARVGDEDSAPGKQFVVRCEVLDADVLVISS